MNLPDATVGISVSSPSERELALRGVGAEHLGHLAVEVARQVLAAGASVAYGGDLRQGGFTRTLVALLRTYSRRDRPPAERVRFYLAWPVWRDPATSEEAELALYGTPIRVARVADADDRPAIALEYRAMRQQMAADTDARIAVGGRLSGQSGRWPGIAEETYFALVARQPVFVAGGLGGAADRVARALRRDWPAELTTDYQLSHTPGYEELLKAEVGTSEEELRSVLAGADLLNGLDDEENALLFETVDLDLVVALMLRGLTRAVASRR